MILEAALVASLALECAPNVTQETMQALIYHESSGNPYSIGVVSAPLVEQPKTKEEAIQTANALIAAGENISLGLGQINYKNFKVLGLTVETAFDYCPNIKAADEILSACFTRANNDGHKDQEALKAALSCYYSNNFRTGQIKEKQFGDTSYVERIAKANERLVPAIKFASGDAHQTTSKEKTVKQNGVVNRKEKVDNWDVFNEF